MPTDVILLLVTEDGDVEPVNGTVMLSGTLVIGVGYPMISIGNNTYAATIPAEEIVEGTLRVMYKCGGLLYDELIGSITLFDPSGFITDAVTQQPVIGASVELFKLDDWTVKSDASDAMPETCHTIITKGTTPWTQPTPTSVVPTETPNPMATSTLAPGDVPRPTTSSLAP
ncbi:MAG: hypothetical protein B6242_12880 [Anaerolineaceae bacterium 4572_78]|nr:MAG: hypothetical protein B6242_12880 [Anaerolineaceae bacterium 4572_78]